MHKNLHLQIKCLSRCSHQTSEQKGNIICVTLTEACFCWQMVGDGKSIVRFFGESVLTTASGNPDLVF